MAVGFASHRPDIQALFDAISINADFFIQTPCQNWMIVRHVNEHPFYGRGNFALSSAYCETLRGRHIIVGA
jgi:hypothetical protein